MGMATLNTEARLLASLGGAGPVSPQFEPAADVPGAGVLLAVPALLASGLLHRHEPHLAMPTGYYSLTSVLLVLALMALARLKSLEWLRYAPPGEWGKVLGLDRIPEVRTLREKIAGISKGTGAIEWSAQLCRQWMANDPHSAGVLYVDGHVRVYHGEQTHLPRHYVARERLCLRATADYWVNAMDGKPFFVVSTAVDPGLLKVLEEEIVARLEREVPGQPTPEQLAADPLLHRFTLVFDREGYSPQFLERMRQRRIACLTYHKFPGEDWPVEEFHASDVELVGGQRVKMELAERWCVLPGDVHVREIRRRATHEHQTSILVTDFKTPAAQIAPAMFARWSQENFFKYMREHFGLDRLIDYQLESIPETTRVINPAHRDIEGQIRRVAALRTRKAAEFAGLSLGEPIAAAKVVRWEQKKAQLQDVLSTLGLQLAELKVQRTQTKKHIAFGELAPEARFQRLSTHSKHFVDTIKMIAYRAETAMAHVLRDQMARHDDARSLLRNIYRADADLVPNHQTHTLTVRLHHLTNHAHDRALAHLCEQLTATETVFPGSDLRLVYEMVSPQNP